MSAEDDPAGWVLPALVALAALPALLRSMGAERFGVLSLAWALVGYFSLFDLGIGRALTQALAERLGRDAQEDSPALTWTALWLLLLFGAACGLALAAAGTIDTPVLDALADHPGTGVAVVSLAAVGTYLLYAAFVELPRTVAAARSARS